jgi:small basic protein
MNEILNKLSGGDLRSEGRAEEVAGEVIDDPRLLADLTAGLRSEDRLIRGRTCMTLEVVSRDRPDLLTGTIPRLIDLAATDTVSQVRWHLAEVFANVPVSADRSDRIVSVMLAYLGDKSRIVKSCAVQALGVLGAASSRREEIADRVRALKDESKGMAKAVRKALDRLGEE